MNIWQIQSFRGGLSEQEERGIAGAFKTGANLNIRKEIDSLSCNQAMKKDTGTVVTDLCHFFAQTDGDQIFAFGDTGNIYRKYGGNWTKIYTDPDGRITGACEFNNQLFWCTSTKLKQAAPGSSLTPVIISTLLEQATFHKMKTIGNKIFIGNGYKQAVFFDDGSFNASVETFLTNQEVRTLEGDENYCYVGINNTRQSGRTFIHQLNTITPIAKQSTKNQSYNTIDAMLISDELKLIFGENSDIGTLFNTNFTDSIPLYGFEGGKMSPDAMASKDRMIYSGIYGYMNAGLYTYGRKRQNMPTALNLEHTLSCETPDIIGGVFVSGNDIYAAWKLGSEYGIDVIDHNNKAPATYRSLDFYVRKQTGIVSSAGFKTLRMLCLPLSTENMGIEVFYRANKSRTGSGANYVEDGWYKAKLLSDANTVFNRLGEMEVNWSLENVKANVLEVRIDLTPDGNLSPEIFKDIDIIFE